MGAGANLSVLQRLIGTCTVSWIYRRQVSYAPPRCNRWMYYFGKSTDCEANGFTLTSSSSSPLGIDGSILFCTLRGIDIFTPCFLATFFVERTNFDRCSRRLAKSYRTIIFGALEVQFKALQGDSENAKFTSPMRQGSSSHR